MMKTEFLKYGLSILLLGYISGCDHYEQKIIEKHIYVDRQSLSLFIGQTVQLTASPTDGTYQYQWSSEDPSVATVTSNGLVEVISEGFTNIVVSSGDLFTKVPLTAVVRVPLEDVSVSESFLELIPGGKKTILLTYIPDNANDIPEYLWSSENPNIASVKITGEITGVGEGITTVVYRIGDIVKEIVVDVAYTRPFKGPHILSAAAPYELPAANFDLGGEGYAFHDQDANNHIGNDNYRRNNGDKQSTPVEIEGNGSNIGYTNPGEWLLYTVEVSDGGEYKVDVLLASPNPAGFHLEVDGVNVTGTISTPATGGWGNYQLISTPEDKLTLTLTKGRHKIKYYFEAGHNLRGFRFTKR
ncbi:Ig-like domain-containing protein [Proteiniphilum sp. X52]|uniref:Ig-like domain-containing protein n=1 Tax=Proteiniphilum sp. X52 TaxID=2382159 RepID=UPI000F09FAA5|nr:Ig-like domain-containing protein [Proteiniphilum sp. X52]RNC63827.1 carbohydrate-binding protein [Proteiniphilum sp. X52]